MAERMSDAEICREFRQAKKKSVEVGILADLNMVSKEEIIRILKAGGETVPPACYRKTEGEAADAAPPPAPVPDETETVSAGILCRADNVLHPDHYNQGSIECIDAIRASLGLAGFSDFCRGNVMKYLWRYRQKGGVEDLKKARTYLGWMIEAEEARE